jgi:hypothetical protein
MFIWEQCSEVIIRGASLIATAFVSSVVGEISVAASLHRGMALL